MSESIVSPAYAEYEFMDKTMNRINELIALCNQATTERDQLQARLNECLDAAVRAFEIEKERERLAKPVGEQAETIEQLRLELRVMELRAKSAEAIAGLGRT